MIYETLIDSDQAKINAIVSSVREHLSNDGNVDLDLLMATLEKLNEVKKEVREAEKERIAAIKEKSKEAAKELGRKYAMTLKVGDLITFVYGSANCQKTATLPVEKVGQSSVQVSYTPEMLSPNSKTAKRNILFAKIIIPKSFKI